MKSSVQDNMSRVPEWRPHRISKKDPRLLISEAAGFSPRALRQLRAHASVECADLNRSELLASIADTEILWIRLRHRIDAEVLAAARQLRIIVTPTTGLNHIDLKAAERRGISVVSLRGETEFLNNVRATAEHTIGLILALFRQIPAATSHVREGGWNRDLFKGIELHRKTVGIVGYGRLGRVVAKYLRAFDLNLLAVDPAHARGAVMEGVPLVELDTLLHESDLVTLHVDLREDNHGFFGKEQFAAMRPGSWFINTARGELVDETSLIHALRSRHLRGAAIDVLSGEQSGGMENHPLVEYAACHRNLIITPHIGGCTQESMSNTEEFLADKLLQILADFHPSGCPRDTRQPDSHQHHE